MSGFHLTAAPRLNGILFRLFWKGLIRAERALDVSAWSTLESDLALPIGRLMAWLDEEIASLAERSMGAPSPS